ncbi:23S rRNA pseudouridine(955/2504/2580) synthase RluC [Endozoicomonas elysicola]|uniref:Pseudouridine synthase n=1 Tax=Endozoicomonas elysicola TaxID=305900 RepID=A0A081KAZ5_9GAMM|nr:23S rRNA pseudouridine(955/2504/2580) synthase RluC [Endozoicomonas elysicola]KEI71321.1 23S rRNA pseudouridylate synthase [Endozoicomonas elysicola]
MAVEDERSSQDGGEALRVRLITIDEDTADQRIDNYLLRVLKGVPKTRIYRIVRKGEVRVNKKRITADYRLQPGDVVRIPPVRVAEANAPARPADSVIAQLEKAVLYEDDQLLIINKPSGLAVHGGSGLSYGAIEALRQLRPENRTLELVHRLDRDTSGCLVIAKRRSMLRHLHNQLQQKGKVEKLYHALVVGKWPARKQLVNAPLLKNVLQSGERMVRVHVDGKKSRTAFRVLDRFPNMTLVEAYPITGRTHQIRVHCLHAGHAIAGDEKYGMDEDNQSQRQFGLKRLFLHAASIQFELPDGRLLKVEAPLPDELLEVLSVLKGE